ncbi:LysM peptidoglycan-binding domain-containing protein [Fictibacillus phosphorivorans]|uniref:LysM peptidoglycan-binding domain-containing protein n=1 Tax=Fictibacillus phosphorivorans TaxID=1221500 RepID=UPI00129324B8|nr:LysM domain-containing protein [Fictibacillus phosphorivorans]MQR95565.1 LysM domain-containing protein [Fictibacillus phosphorivorans]
MKRFIRVCVIMLILYVVAYDLKIGTLPQSSPANAEIQTEKQQDQKNKQKFKTYEVTPGDTLISVVEKLNSNNNYSIVSMIKDFKSLNPEVNPENIQIGKSYKFPVYHQ